MAGRKPTLDEATKERLSAAYKRSGSYAAAIDEVGCAFGPAYRYLKIKSKDSEKPAASSRSLKLSPAPRSDKPSTSVWDLKRTLEDGYSELQGIASQLHTQISAGGELSALLISAYTGIQREMRAHAMACARLLESLTRAEAIAAFQTIVMDAIATADEPTKERILAELRARSSAGLLDFAGGAAGADESAHARSA